MHDVFLPKDVWPWVILKMSQLLRSFFVIVTFIYRTNQFTFFSFLHCTLSPIWVRRECRCAVLKDSRFFFLFDVKGRRPKKYSRFLNEDERRYGGVVMSQVFTENFRVSLKIREVCVCVWGVKSTRNRQRRRRRRRLIVCVCLALVPTNDR